MDNNFSNSLHHIYPGMGYTYMPPSVQYDYPYGLYYPLPSQIQSNFYHPYGGCPLPQYFFHQQEAPQLIFPEHLKRISPERSAADLQVRKQQGLSISSAKIHEQAIKSSKEDKARINRITETIVYDLISKFVQGPKNINEFVLVTKKSLLKHFIGDDQIAEQKLIFKDVVLLLEKRLLNFRKTKEQMIKYIFRRVYQKIKTKRLASADSIYLRLEKSHEKNVRLYKSMNSSFLNREFSNLDFREVYKQFVDQMDEQFDKENQERIARLSVILANHWTPSKISTVVTEKKMPWTLEYKTIVKELALQLLESVAPKEHLQSDLIKAQESESI